MAEEFLDLTQTAGVEVAESGCNWIGGGRLVSRHCLRLLVASTERCDSPFLYSFLISGYAR